MNTDIREKNNIERRGHELTTVSNLDEDFLSARLVKKKESGVVNERYIVDERGS